MTSATGAATTPSDPDGTPPGGALRLGIVGVGAIATALVDGLSTGPNAQRLRIVLSPRSADRAAALAARFDQVRVAADNQEVLDSSDVVLLCVLPGQVADTCRDLEFRADHVVAGLAAGWPPSTLAPLVAPATQVCQLIPLPMVALRTGPIVVAPHLPEIADLLDGCGELVVLDDESQVIALSCASATMSTYFELQRTIVDWAVSTGLPERTSHDYVTALLLGLATEGRTTEPGERASLAAAHETPGGLNEQVRTALTEAGAFRVLTEQLDHLRATRMLGTR